ncbi:hypothetical protein QG37_06772 [Candidozyma auris]|uniref:Uncharacterized protein n=1 Tax=Candidozyma auris TaxID=498019 RepID=A0A0L0NRY1_CANAR|nr:hypothetical protein QG37_06772 [[Candida] auris]
MSRYRREIILEEKSGHAIVSTGTNPQGSVYAPLSPSSIKSPHSSRRKAQDDETGEATQPPIVMIMLFRKFDWFWNKNLQKIAKPRCQCGLWEPLFYAGCETF